MAKSGTTSTRYWRVLRNFADGSCAIYSVLQAYLFLNGEHHHDAERAFTGNPAPALLQHIRELVRLCRQATARSIDETDGTWGDGTTFSGERASTESLREDLSTFAAFKETILNIGGEDDSSKGWYDSRALLLLAKILGIEVKVVRKISKGRASWYQAVDGPDIGRAPVLLLWSGRNHYEAVVPNVSVKQMTVVIFQFFMLN